MFAPGMGLTPFQTPFDLFGALCFLIVGIWVIFILVAVWVYRDAESRRMNGVLWLIVVILLGLIGLIVYLIVRSDHPVGGYPAPYAPGYAAYPSPYAPPYAPQQPPAPPQTAAAGTCRNCGAPVNPGAAFCARCGAKV